MSRATVHRGRVAVLGLGVAGLTALKNLLEQGFDVTGFEKNDYVGGLWQYNEDPNQTTVLKVTRANTSKQCSAYSDFPFPDDVPDYPTADQICEYMRSYASHFSLVKHFRLGVTIERVERAPTSGPVRWNLRMRDKGVDTSEEFDRVLVTTGPFSRPFVPKLEGIENYKGETMHSQQYKGPEPLAGKRVVVAGLGNSASDIAVELCGHAEQVFLSHRTGTRVMKRQNNGRPFDHPVSRRRIALAGKVNRTFPRLAGSLSSFAMDKIFLKQNPEYKTEWKFLPAQGMAHSPAIINDDLINRLLNHDIINLSGLLRFTPTGIVTADQGEVQVDAVILATGSHFDYSILSDEANPTAFPAPEWEECEHRNELAFPRLYQTLFSTRYPDSLAFIGPCRGYTFAVLANNDVVSTAIARTWRGSYTLPSQSEMEAWCDANYNRALRMIKTWRIPKTGTDPSAFERFLNEAAGNQVNDILGWGWEGWKFWWTERELYGLIMDGICTPFVYRLMEGKEGARKKWEGAREAIYKANGKVLG